MISWFTVLAQIVNFLILIGLLKYFLYGRIMDAIENREKEIESRQAQADQNLKSSQEELDLAKAKNLKLDEQREELLTAVRSDVENFRKQQMEKVRIEIDGVQSRWSDSIREEQDSFLHELSKRTSDSVCKIARSALTDLADVSLESRIVSRFIDMVSSLDSGKRQALIETLHSAGQVAVVQTTHDLPDHLKRSLVSDLERELAVKLDVRFETLDDLECGIALQTNSHKLGWNLRDYLTDLENDLRLMLEEEAIAKPKRSNEAAIK